MGLRHLVRGPLNLSTKNATLSHFPLRLIFLDLNWWNNNHQAATQGEMLEEPNVVGQVELEHPNVHDLREMDQFKQPQSDQILPNCSGDIAIDISKIDKKPSQLKKFFTIILGNFSKRVTI